MPITFEQTVARRVRYLRERLGWSQQDLADRLTNLGMPVDRTGFARLENGKRGVSLDDTMRLAYALNVAPIHLMVDPDGEEPVAPIPDSELTPAEARAWIRGELPMLFQDPRAYFMNVPREEFERYRLSGSSGEQEATVEEYKVPTPAGGVEERRVKVRKVPRPQQGGLRDALRKSHS